MRNRSLREVGLEDVAEVGGKAARLGHLARAGLHVPDGVVIALSAHEAELRERVVEAVTDLGPGPLAVRSSGAHEDMTGASFAGQYETLLNVEGEDAIEAAVRTCRASATSDRVLAYAWRRAESKAGSIAVLLQRMVDASAAGVAHSANPVTGDREEVVISAARGLGERLVGGEVAADEWVIRPPDLVSCAGTRGAITDRQARDIAALARSAASLLGAPQDIEWAIAGGDLYLLQSRPITALPDEVAWDSPMPRAFARHFRFGEWIGDPVTPLFESWLLSSLEGALSDQYRRWFGITLARPFHVVVNGWYFHALPALPEGPAETLRFIGGALPRLFSRPRRLAMMLPQLAHLGIEEAIREWREVALPHHLATVARAEASVEDASQRQLVTLIDELADEAGVYFAHLTLVAGFAAKAELPLGAFYRRHLYPQMEGSHLELLRGLAPQPLLQPHAVQSLDWFFPTTGEMGPIPVVARAAGQSAARMEAESRARQVLARTPKLAAEFEKLLAAAQRFQPLREECVGHLTRGWPVMRRSLRRLADQLAAGGVLTAPEDIHFIRRSELLSALDGGRPGPPTEERRATWGRQRRLRAPLVIGPVAPMTARILADLAENTRSPSPARGIRGVAASPGRATGPVRVIRDATEFERLLPGEVLVAPVTTPAWTPLFSRAVAVVTDTGSIGSHASQVAREYGIPAVVCAEGATASLRVGQVVTVDGGAGAVELVWGGYR